MIGRSAVWLVVLALASCRSYDYAPKLSDQAGLTPPDQFARYGKEQAEAVAIARAYGKAGNTDSAMAYARSLPDVADIGADSQGYRLTIRFKSGWRTAVPPIDDGKSGAQTPGVGAPAKADAQ